MFNEFDKPLWERSSALQAMTRNIHQLRSRVSQVIKYENSILWEPKDDHWMGSNAAVYPFGREISLWPDVGQGLQSTA